MFDEKLDEKLKERFFNTYKFSNDDNNKFVLLLWKNVYPYEYMDDWEKFNKTSLPEKEVSYRQSTKYGIYYWCRLRPRKKNL